jgi:hypothetical protein
VSKIVNVELPTPPMGGKIWLLEEKGIFVLERCAGTLRTIAMTHAGSGAVYAYDGIPDDYGYFSDPPSETDPAFWTRNGRPIYRANPAVMGSWMCDGGFYNGLTIIAAGGTESACAIASIVWVAFRRPPLLELGTHKPQQETPSDAPRPTRVPTARSSKRFPTG